ncbi:Lysine-specific demethylase 8 [Leucoagaricus sp. SymC.cos]|nr:Lysine-specific demethylase 8 [Leucoagaricus sp. SymC.cos]
MQCHLFPESTELVQASGSRYTQLVKLVDAILAGSFSEECLVRDFQALQNLSHQNMQFAASTTRWVWRILYVDCCILQSIVLLCASTAYSVIGLLDRAIIIAGGGDEMRLNLILSLIGRIQHRFLPLPTPSRKHLGKSHHSSFEPLLTAYHEVPSIKANLSLLSFQNQYSKAPFVIRGYALDWPALNDRPWSSVDYLLSVSGPSRIVPVEVGQDYRDEDWNQVLMDWDNFLYALADGDGNSKAPQEILYLAQYNLLRQFPSLCDDIMIPDYVYCSLSPQDFSGYKAPDNPDGAILNVWLGPKGATSPAHFDPYYNFYVQVVGYKTVWLSSPASTAYMESVSLAQPKMNSMDSSRGNPLIFTGGTDSLNTSRLDVFSRGNMAADFPLFADKVVPEAMSVVLGPGDLLFFPPGWWHGMRNESTSISMSMWF